MHLSKEDMIKAVVDDTDLPAAARDHLLSCPVCVLEKERLERDLDLMGEMAEKFVPVPGKKVVWQDLPEREHWWSWNWQKAVSVGMAVAAVILLVCGPMLWKMKTNAHLARLNRELIQDEMFMSEVNRLSQNALPSFWQDVEPESEPAFDDEFMEFVVPSPGDNLVSGNTGGRQCC